MQWIPAYAGMTIGRSLRGSGVGRDPECYCATGLSFLYDQEFLVSGFRRNDDAAVTVVPAQAGIQKILFRCDGVAVLDVWIPAFAGMTLGRKPA